MSALYMFMPKNKLQNKTRALQGGDQNFKMNFMTIILKED